MKYGIFVAGLLATFMLSATAFAQCQCGRTCGEQVFVGEELPSNARGIAAWQTWTAWEDVRIDLEKLGADGGPVEITLELESELVIGDAALIVPAEPFEEGASYRLSLNADSEVVDDIACGRGTARSLTNEFVVGPAAEPLGAVPEPTIADPERLDASWPDGTEECTRTLDTLKTSVDFELPTGALDYLDMVQWQVELDGEPGLYTMSVCETFPPGRAPTEDTLAQIAVACSPWQDGYPVEGARTPGEKTVIVTGRLAGTDVVFSTGAVQVDLNCEAMSTPETETSGCSSTGGKAAGPVVLLLLGIAAYTRRRTCSTC